MLQEAIEGLNPHQKKAVLTIAGRVLILAGAGSGKTRVLTIRMAHLVQHHQIPPSSILGLTFTNKAAAEMRHRFTALANAKAAKYITLCTFHSFCMQILRQEAAYLGYTRHFTLYDEKDIQRLVALIARDELEHEGELPSFGETMSVIGNAKNRGLVPEEIGGTGSEWHDHFVRTLYKRLQDSLRAYNALDFDSLLSQTVHLFEKYPEVLKKYQDRYRYIMIDEYQDTNPVQYRLAELLSRDSKNLCVVGDDDQSIYGWRGADVKNILSFGQVEQSTVIKLEQNYRSTNTILKAANAVISQNKERHSKALWSHNGEGEPIEVFHAPTEIEEAQAVAYRIAKYREKYKLKWKDFAILYRSNASSRLFELALLKQTWNNDGHWLTGVPYQVFGGTEFYERREVKDLMAYLRVIVNPLDQEALLRIINQPRRGIGEGTLDALTAYNRSKHIPLWEVLNHFEEISELKEKVTSRAADGIHRFLAVLQGTKERFNQGSMKEAFEWLIETIQYQKAIDEEVKSDQMRQFKWENVQECVSAIAEYEQAPLEEGQEKSLSEFITSIPLGNENAFSKQKKNEHEDRVSLMTLHSSKGLEFPVCFLVCMEDHIIPHEKSVKETGVEEERRLMYVAITRAMRLLIISMARKRKRMGKDASSLPSRFLYEIPKDLMKSVEWDNV